MLKYKYSISLLTTILKCSRSGYYDWIKLGRPQHKKYDQEIANLILEQYKKDTRQGIVSLRMNIKAIYGICLTNKTIYRYMLLLNIQSVTARKPKKYGKIAHHNIPNHIKRDFKANKPNEKWSIDVTYIHTIEGVEYLCAIKDMYDKSIVSYNQSRFNDNELVLKTLKKAIRKNKNEINNLILHSDQGSQFTSKDYGKILKENEIIHSVSYKGSCVDNVPIESWFSLLKCESIYMNKKITREKAIFLVDEYVTFYNDKRLQEQIKELTPKQYRQLALI